MGIFPGSVIPVTSTLVLRWLLCLAPGVIGSVFSHTSDLNIGTPCLRPGVIGSLFSHTSDLNIGTPVATLPGVIGSVFSHTSDLNIDTPCLVL